MPVIAVVNRKGGSGKSTLAAHIAAWCAHRGSSVMLGDVDRQQSARGWLKRRGADFPGIAPWALDQKNMLRVPTGITHVVLDTPGGLHGFELARVVMFADAIIMPLCNSIFDRESAAACHAELMAMPRIASGRCRLVTVGMRIDGRTRAGETLQAWADALGVPFLGCLRETQLYMRSLERGMTLFDLPEQIAAADLRQWKPILDWLEPLFYPPLAANDAGSAAARAMVTRPAVRPAISAPPAAPVAARTAAPFSSPAGRIAVASRLGSSLPDSLLPAQESMVHGSRLSMHGPGRIGGGPVVSGGKPALARNVNSADGLQIPQFLKRAQR